MDHTTIAIGTAAMCVLACALPRPCQAQAQEDKVLLDYPKTPHPKGWKIDGYARLLGNDAVLNALREGKSAAEIEESYQDDLARFLERRKAFLIY